MGRALHGWCLPSYIRKSEKKYGVCCICRCIAFYFFIHDRTGTYAGKKRGKNVPEISFGKLWKRTAEGIFAGEICKAWQLSGTT